MMDIIFSRVNWQFAFVYLDDFVIFCKSVKEHVKQVWTVLRLLMRAVVSLKQKKCFSFN